MFKFFLKLLGFTGFVKFNKGYYFFRRNSVWRFSLVIIVVFLLTGFAFSTNKPLTRKFLLYQSIDYGETIKLNRNLFIVTGGINRGLTAIQITY